MSDRPSLWDRIRHHSAFDTAAVCIGVSWVIVQAAGMFFDLSPRQLRWLGGVLMLGAIPVIAWTWRRAALAVTAETAAGEAPTPTAARRRRGWHVGALAIGLLVLGTAVWWARPLLLGSNVARGADVIAVLPFTTSGEDVEVLSEGMVDLLSTNLDQVGGIHTINPRTVLSRWRRRAADRSPELEDALALGREVDAGSVLIGSAVAVGPRVRLSAQLYDLKGGLLARAGAEGAADSVLVLVDDLSIELLREIWRAREPVPRLRVGAITTRSPQAIRDFLRGEQFYRRSEWDLAAAAFEAAAQHDSAFALAYFRLTEVHGWREGLGAAEARSYAGMTARFAGRLPARDQSLVRAMDLHNRGDVAALDTMRAYVERYPDDPIGWHLLGDVQFHAAPDLGGDVAAIFASFDRVLELDPTFAPAATHPLELSVRVGDSARFTRYARVLQTSGRDPAWTPLIPVMRQLRWAPADSVLPTVGRTVRTAVSRSQMAQGGQGEPPGSRAARPPHQLLAALAVTLASRSLLSDAPDPHLFLAALDTASSSLPADSEARVQLWIAKVLALAGTGQHRAARRVAEPLWAVSPEAAAMIELIPVLSHELPPSYATHALALLERAPASAQSLTYFRALYQLSQGDVVAARPLLRAGLAGESTGPGRRVPDGLFHALEGWAALIEGDTTAAIEGMRAGLREAGYGRGPNLFSGPVRWRLAVLLASRPATRAEALRLLAFGVQPFASGYEKLGEALEGSGDPSGAARFYARALALWSDADPELQPRVAAVRRALERVTAERPGR